MIKRLAVNIWSLTDSPVYYCWPSPVMSFLLPRQTELMNLFYGLTALEPSKLNQNPHKYPLYTVSSYRTGNITSSLRRRIRSLFIARINMKHVLTAWKRGRVFNVGSDGAYFWKSGLRNLTGKRKNIYLLYPRTFSIKVVDIQELYYARMDRGKR